MVSLALIRDDFIFNVLRYPKSASKQKFVFKFITVRSKIHSQIVVLKGVSFIGSNLGSNRLEYHGINIE